MRPKLELTNGAILILDTAPTERDVAHTLSADNLSQVLPAISGLCEDILSALKNAKPDKAKVEFGIKLEFETSRLMAVLCSSSASADLKLTLEWGGSSPPTAPS